MSCPLYIVDAFARAPFTGNPAAVCVLPAPKPAQWMQTVAAELNQSETAFLWHLRHNEWVLRWFTPVCEVNLCGHATLVSAHVLWQRGVDRQTIGFRSRGGLLSASRKESAIELDFPLDPPTDLEPELQASISRVLGCQPEWMGRGREDIVTVLKSASHVRDMEPDLALLQSLPCRGLIVTAPGDEDGIDFVSRFFAPAAGISEDPVTGSAHCLLAAYWGSRLGKTELRGYQASTRTGIVDMVCRGRRVKLRGTAITILTGTLHD